MEAVSVLLFYCTYFDLFRSFFFYFFLDLSLSLSTWMRWMRWTRITCCKGELGMNSCPSIKYAMPGLAQDLQREQHLVRRSVYSLGFLCELRFFLSLFLVLYRFSLLFFSFFLPFAHSLPSRRGWLAGNPNARSFSSLRCRCAALPLSLALASSSLKTGESALASYVVRKSMLFSHGNPSEFAQKLSQS